MIADVRGTSSELALVLLVSRYRAIPEQCHGLAPRRETGCT